MAAVHQAAPQQRLATGEADAADAERREHAERVQMEAAESGLKKLVRRIVPGIGHSSSASQATVVVPEEPTDRA